MYAMISARMVMILLRMEDTSGPASLCSVGPQGRFLTGLLLFQQLLGCLDGNAHVLRTGTCHN